MVPRQLLFQVAEDAVRGNVLLREGLRPGAHDLEAVRHVPGHEPEPPAHLGLDERRDHPLLLGVPSASVRETRAGGGVGSWSVVEEEEDGPWDAKKRRRW